MKLVWLGHSAFHLSCEGREILIDPFFAGNPKFPAGYEDGLDRVDDILLTHGHEDHLGDTLRLCGKYGATLVAQPEICKWAKAKGVEQIDALNIGGTIARGSVAVSMTPALHTSSIMVDGSPLYMGEPAGLVLATGLDRIYHSGDTGLFSDMALIQRLWNPRVGLICIGDRFTMGPEAAAIACNEFLDLEVVVPTHWGTFPPLTGTPEAFCGLLRRGRMELPVPGRTLNLARTGP